MKEVLNKILNVISEEGFAVVKELHHTEIKEGDEVYLDGGWRIWLHSKSNSRLTHAYYMGDLGMVKHYTNHTGRFLINVKVK